jgi:hypothetical protein
LPPQTPPGDGPSTPSALFRLVFFTSTPDRTKRRVPYVCRVLQLPEKEARLDQRPGSCDFPHGGGPPTPLARFSVGPPAGTCCHSYAATFARFGRAILGPMHPLRSIRRFHRCGVSRSIALHTCQVLKPTVPYPCMSAVRSRRPAVSAFASESHLRSPGGISGPAGQPARPTRASSRESRVPMHKFARDQPSPSICSRNPELPVAARRESPF